MAHNFRKDLEGMDLTPDADMRSTEEIEAEADKKALERPETPMELGGEHDYQQDLHDLAEEQRIDPAPDLTDEQVREQAAKIEQRSHKADQLAEEDEEDQPESGPTIFGQGARAVGQDKGMAWGERDHRKIGKEKDTKKEKEADRKRRASMGKRTIDDKAA